MNIIEWVSLDTLQQAIDHKDRIVFEDRNIKLYGMLLDILTYRTKDPNNNFISLFERLKEVEIHKNLDALIAPIIKSYK